MKNRFYLHDVKTDKWTVVPYDLKDAFATDNRGSGRNCTAEGNPCGNTPTYCILSCEAFNSPLACDASHPQDTFPESDGRSSYNHLVDAVLKSPAWRAAYFRKLWSVMETYLASGWLQNQVAELHDQIAADARLDDAKWHCGDVDVGVKALLQQMADRRAQLYGTYLYMFKPYVSTEKHTVTSFTPVEPVVRSSLVMTNTTPAMPPPTTPAVMPAAAPAPQPSPWAAMVSETDESAMSDDSSSRR